MTTKIEQKPIYKCAGPVIGVWAEGDIDRVETKEAKEVVRRKIGFKKRIYCGVDITDAIEGLPKDSVVYDIRCDKCQNTAKAMQPKELVSEEKE